MALANAKAQPLTNGKLKLMICDDSNIIRRKIERELQIDRLQVTATAANGKQAVEAFRKEPADVVTMDLTMPEMDGIETLAVLQQRFPRVRVIAMSGKPATHVPVMQELGAAKVLKKPFTMDELFDALEATAA